MSKSYSTKALPSGTVLREWRLEEVLGVGGFGIVYKGRGIYFDELVAIKEYFPSAISERNDGDTVVPIDSDAEEVHALGLKKFVEEAKLLWNLSTPTRHPNIVSVRSLFEIHGTAYMVMDFEDGDSLSKMLREGRRFNEASLRALIVPIAEGLDRAHRVGVLHRDIKPPNILVNGDRPVLIDFGSARFESGDATSTKVTFHTPPYAAIEQYVKTYKQGPWTDVYALGVVMYECITGEKPPEVLERMHGGLGTALAGGSWPGYSQGFLEAVDAAMAIRPDERPQSIQQWLELFDEKPGKAKSKPAPVSAEPDSDATRFMPFAKLTEDIIPVAPAPPGFDPAVKVETAVPDHPDDAKFKRAGQDTNITKSEEFQSLPPEPDAPEPAAEPPSPPAARQAPTETGAPAPKKSGKAGILAGVAVAVLALAGGGWYLTRGGGGPTAQDAAGGDDSSFTSFLEPGPSDTPTEVATTSANEPLAGAVRGLAGSARQAGAPGVGALDAAATRLSGLYTGLDTLTGEAAMARQAEIASAVRAGAAQFAGALGRDADARAQRASRQAGDTPNAAAMARLRQARGQLGAAVSAINGAADPNTALAAARRALAAWSGVSAAAAAAARNGAAPLPGATETASAEATPTPTPTASATAAAITGVSSGKLAKFNSTVASARELAASVISLGRVSRPPSGASKEEMDKFRSLEQGKNTAQDYLRYLDGLTRSIASAKSDREVDRYIQQAEQTKRYLSVMLSRSSAAAK